LTDTSLTAHQRLEKLPVLDKQTLREQRDQFIAERERMYWRNQTSGSTGTSLLVDLNARTYKLIMALLVDHEEQHGIRPGHPRATFAGRVIQPPEHNRPPFWRYNRADNQTLFSTLHLSDENMPHYLRQLEKVQPMEIIGYPSAIYLVAEYCLRHRVTPQIRPAAVVTNSETLFDWQRETIEKAFRCHVADYYGVAEGVVFASQCSAGQYHFNPLLGIVEFLRSDGSIASDGEPARLVCTTLTNTVMPLLRYEVGDEAIRAVGSCPCGLEYPAAQSILGRVDDAVVTRDGRSIGRLDHIFKGLEGVRECQIIQEEVDLIVLKIVRDVSFSQTSEHVLKENLWARLGHEMRVHIDFVERIPRTARGKFKGVVSNLSRYGHERLSPLEDVGHRRHGGVVPHL
jgi:phenylacetate-CoA ligase